MPDQWATARVAPTRGRSPFRVTKTAVQRVPDQFFLTLKMQDKYRLLDANLNRAREGLRVIEDVVRFLYNDKELSRKLRNIRHELSIITGKIYPRLLKSRDSENDVGLTFKEGKRKNLRDILIANFRRAEEGIRVLEEFSRLISADAGDRLKKIRFKVYTIEKEIVTRIS